MLENNKKTRSFFTEKFKRKVLLEYAKGKKPAQILSEFGIPLSQDKKYALKLIHKWKGELYKNINLLELNLSNLDLNYAQQEIDTIGSDDEEDDILDEILTKNNKKL